MTRWLATLGILTLLLLALGLPGRGLGRRGNEAVLRSDAPEAELEVGRRLPELALQGLDGRPLRLTELRGHPVLLVFERSVDW